MSTALQLHSDTMAEWKVMTEQAGVLVKSQFLPAAIKTAEQALAIILTSKELGIGMMQGFRSINIISGTPTISPQLMLALIHRSGQLEDMIITDDGQCCSVTMRRRGLTPHSEAFSMKDAAAIKTTEYVNGDKRTISLSEKYNWRQMPAVMRKWRAIAACARVVFPDVTMGLYTPEELGGEVDAEGELVGEIDLTPRDGLESAPINPPVDTSDPRPKTLGELVTPKQLWMIRNMERETGANVDELCREKFGCDLAEISKKAASVIIDALKGMGGKEPTGSEDAEAKRIKEANAKHQGVITDTGPSKDLMRNPNYGPEIAKRFNAVVQQLTIRGIPPDELLREANVCLHDAGRKQIRSRYEADDESARIICDTFEAWVMIHDRKQQEGRANA